MLPLLKFEPRFKERVWGGRNLERLYGKSLPANTPIGESWEITDRPGEVSRIPEGPLAGRDLRWLMENHAGELLGDARPLQDRFPLLIKILDAQDVLSLQVHPPAARAAALMGEPKTEMWYVADTQPDAAIFVGLRKGVLRSDFERGISDGSVAACIHRQAVRPGDAMFLPSGRVHAIGAGNVIFEIQQNSDTTYRVFDWNRLGLDGHPRELHLAQSMASIDFDDFEPGLVMSASQLLGDALVRPLARCPDFAVDHYALPAGRTARLAPDTMHILGVISGEVTVESTTGSITLRPGRFCLAPASQSTRVASVTDATFLRVEAGR